MSYNQLYIANISYIQGVSEVTPDVQNLMKDTKTKNFNIFIIIIQS